MRPIKGRRELRLEVSEATYDNIYDFINDNGILQQYTVSYDCENKKHKECVELYVNLFVEKYNWSDLIKSIKNVDDREFLQSFIISLKNNYNNEELDSEATYVVFRMEEK